MVLYSKKCENPCYMTLWNLKSKFFYYTVQQFFHTRIKIQCTRISLNATKSVIYSDTVRSHKDKILNLTEIYIAMLQNNILKQNKKWHSCNSSSLCARAFTWKQTRYSSWMLKSFATSFKSLYFFSSFNIWNKWKYVLIFDHTVTLPLF